MKKRDIILILAILFVSVAGLLFILPTHESGTAYIYVGNSIYGKYDLSEDQLIRIENDNGIVNTIEIKDNRIRMKDATCPNGLCVENGWISRNNESICCVPAGVMVVIRAEDGDYDAVTK